MPRSTPVIDPSKNVDDLVNAANRRMDDVLAVTIQRQDDLRVAERHHSREVLELRAQLGEKGEECLKEMADLRAQHVDQLRRAETERLDAIRRVDVDAVQRAAEVQATQAGALATQVTTSAETLRASVAAAATAAQISLAAALEPLQKAIDDLRRSQYQEQGQKTQVVETQAKGSSTGLWVGLAISSFVLLLVLIGTAAAVITALP